MEDIFEINLPLINRKALVKKSPFNLSVLRQNLSSVSLDRIPLIEYFAFIDHPIRDQQIKARVFKTQPEGRWFDASASEDGDAYSPEFGIPEINAEIKKAIDEYESSRSGKPNSQPA